MKRYFSSFFLYLSWIMITILLSRCAIIRTPGFNCGYGRLSESEKNRVVYLKPTDTIMPATNNGNIYAVTGHQFKQLLSLSKTAIVYVWAPHCHSNSCIPLQAIQSACAKRNLDLYILVEYYTDAFSQDYNVLAHPLFSVNEKYYHTVYCNAYMKQFITDLLDSAVVKSNDDLLYKRFYLFSDGNLQKVFDSLDEMESGL